MSRITMRQLEISCDIINKLANTPATYCTKTADGKYSHTNIGHYHLDCAYGGYKLVQTMNEHGGIRVISSNGYTTKKDLHSQLQAIISHLYSQQVA